MPSQSRNISEQEHSIKQRSHALFVEPGQLSPEIKPTRPFSAYLRETPAKPFSPFTKAIFWFLGVLVAALFLAAMWRMSHRRRPNLKPSQPPEAVATATGSLPILTGMATSICQRPTGQE
ncbi:MAG: hypothetical protein ACLQGP_41370 [Isosphaeraceae bacterium]